MTITTDEITFSRASGATRVNAAGLIVGVDFSVTNITIGTGAKNFTLTADASVNRDWPVGSNVRATSQAGAVGTMTGTVASYTPSTQELVLDIAAVTGSGSSTNWRIGSLEKRIDHDPDTLESKGVLAEGAATNFLIGTLNFSGGSWSPSSGGSVVTRVFNAAVSPDGSMNATKLISGTANAINAMNYTVSGVANETKVSVFAKKCEYRYFKLMCTSASLAIFDLENGVISSSTSDVYNVEIVKMKNGWYKLSMVANKLGTVFWGFGGTQFPFVSATFTGDGVSGVYMYGASVTVASGGNLDRSYIPATTAQVTRAADILQITGDSFNEAINPSQGTIVVECEPSDGVQGTVLSLSDGTSANEIKIAQKQSGTASSIMSIASDGVTDVMGLNAQLRNSLSSKGVSYADNNSEVSVAFLGVATSSLGNFLSVGAQEAFMSTSDGGSTFGVRYLGSHKNGVHFGLGRFVTATRIIGGGNAAGSSNGAVEVSTDGLAWRRVSILGLTQDLTAITSNGTNQYVAVGNSGVIYTSPDAEAWTARVSGVPQTITGVTYGGGLYVASYALGFAGILTSTDGITWTSRNGGSANTMQDVAYNGSDLYVGVAGAGDICRSSDGITWTNIISAGGNTNTLLGIHFADGLWVAVGNIGTVVTSTDGITWTNRTANSGTTSNINDVKFFNGKFYYVGSITGGNIFENTTANITANVPWTSRATIGSNTYNGIATNGSRLVICGLSGSIATSEDGNAFTSRTGNGSTLTDVAYGNGTYVVVGNAANGSGLIATVNPTTFEYQRRVSGITGNLNRILFLNGVFFYVGASANSIGNSSDGIAWVNRLSGQLFFDIAFGNGTYVAVGNAGTRSVSSDGNSWNNGGTVATAQTLNGIDFANGLFVAVGNAGTIITSPNGTTWTLRTSGATKALLAVHYSARDNQWYVAGDNGTILRSADAITWASIANDATVGIFDAGVLQANPLAGKFIPNQRNRVAVAWSESGVSVSINGGAVVSDPSITMPTIDRYGIGISGDQSRSWNSTIKSQKAYRAKMTDSELQALSRVL